MLPIAGQKQILFVFIEKPFEQYVHELWLQETHVEPYKEVH